MEKKEIDLMPINTLENIFYLTGRDSLGYHMYMNLLLPIDGGIKLILRKGKLRNARTYSWLSEDQLIGYDNTDDPTELAVKTIRKSKLLMMTYRMRSGKIRKVNKIRIIETFIKNIKNYLNRCSMI